MHDLDQQIQSIFDHAAQLDEKALAKLYDFDLDSTTINDLRRDLLAALESANEDCRTEPIVVGANADYEIDAYQGYRALAQCKPSAFKFAVLIEFKR